MTLQEFKSSNYQTQVALLSKAVFISKREGSNYTALLYQLDAFYIEVFKHKKYQYIYRVESFEDTDKLSPYLDKMGGISSLLLKLTFLTECVVW